jgi:hypothetical protein
MVRVWPTLKDMFFTTTPCREREKGETEREKYTN